MNTNRYVLTALILLASANVADASVVNKIVSFSADTFQSAFGATAPNDPVTGSFSITLDDALDYTNSTIGISLGSLDIALSSALSFNYNSVTDRLEVGGIANGASVINYSPADNDFWLFINGFLSGAPVFDQLGYARAALNGQYWYTINGTGSVGVNDAPPPAVPLPAALPLLAAALGGLALLRRGARTKPRIWTAGQPA